ncbi:MAG: RING finger domain-containing protein, partial [Nitrososphaerota archaeon]
FKPEVGAIAALFTGVAMAGGGFISAVIGFVALRPSPSPSQVPIMAYTPSQVPAVEYETGTVTSYEEPSLSREEEVFEELLRQEESAVEVRDSQAERAAVGPQAVQPPRAQAASMECAICGDQIPASALKTCGSCGAPMHRECVETWRDIGGRCPNCGAPLG